MIMRHLAVLLTTAAVLAAVPASAIATTASTNRSPAAASVTTTTTPGGISVGPPLSTTPQAPGGTVTTAGGGGTPFFLDIPALVEHAINNWFKGLVTDALNPTLALVGKTVLSTPQLATQSRVAQLWQISLGIGDALLVLFAIAGALLVMSHETVQTRHALKDILPRLLLGAIAANASLALSGQMIALANALSAGMLGVGVNPSGAATRLEGFVVDALGTGGIFLIFLGLACAVVAVLLLILYIVRTATIVLLVCAAPLMLLCHALPQTDGLAQLWWRGLIAALGVQVAQALVLTAAARVFLTPDRGGVLGFSVTGGLVDMLIALCLLWVLVRIPFWAKDMAMRARPSMAARMAKTYVVAKVLRSGALLG
jgi:hypothetical protein